MSEGEKIGSNAWSNFIERGRVEAAQFNEGLRAVDALPIPQAEAPVAEQFNYVEALNRHSEMAEARAVEPEGMSH